MDDKSFVAQLRRGSALLDTLNELAEEFPEAGQIFGDSIGKILGTGKMRELACRSIDEANGDLRDAARRFLELLDEDAEFQKVFKQPFLHLAIMAELGRVEATDWTEAGSPAEPSELEMVGLLVMFECMASTCENGFY